MSIRIILKNIQASGNSELFNKYIVIEHLQHNVRHEKFNYDSEFKDLEKNADFNNDETLERMRTFCQKYISFLLFLKGFDVALFNIPKEAKTIENLQLETITSDHIFDTLFLVDETIASVQKISADTYAGKCQNPKRLHEKLHGKLLGGSTIDVENLCENQKFKSIIYKPQIFDFYTYLMIEYFLIFFLAFVGFIAFPQVKTIFSYFHYYDLTEFDFYLEIVGRCAYLFLITYCVDILLNGRSSLLLRRRIKSKQD